MWSRNTLMIDSDFSTQHLGVSGRVIWAFGTTAAYKYRIARSRCVAALNRPKPGLSFNGYGGATTAYCSPVDDLFGPEAPRWPQRSRRSATLKKLLDIGIQRPVDGRYYVRWKMQSPITYDFSYMYCKQRLTAIMVVY